MKKNIFKRHYTLIEMLTVIAIIAIVAGLAIPAIGKARRHAQETSALAGCNSIAMALKQFEGAYSKFPNIALEKDANDVYTPVGGGSTSSTDATGNVQKYDEIIFALSGLLPKTSQPDNAEANFKTLNRKKTQFLQVPQDYLEDGSFYKNPWKERYFIVYGSPVDKHLKFKIPGQTDVTNLGSGIAVFAVVPKTDGKEIVTSWNGIITLK